MAGYTIDNFRTRWGGELDTEDVESQLTRGAIQLHDSHFQPLEDEMLTMAQDRGYVGERARDARNAVSQQFRAAEGAPERQLERQQAAAG